jgi:hypothetical protein
MATKRRRARKKTRREALEELLQTCVEDPKSVIESVDTMESKYVTPKPKRPFSKTLKRVVGDPEEFVRSIGVVGLGSLKIWDDHGKSRRKRRG